jgi:macrodomain Ter protein organizer (MatP/YcbG family)
VKKLVAFSLILAAVGVSRASASVDIIKSKENAVLKINELIDTRVSASLENEINQEDIMLQK